jgi:hypothetical protein
MITPILNHDVDFSQAPQQDQAAFSGPPTRTVFQAHDTIYRIVSIRDVEYSDGTVGGNSLFDSPWWIPAHTFREITMRAHRTRQPLIAVARSGLAVMREFNPHMDWIAVVKMKSPAYGWVGKTAPQPEFRDDSQVWLMGGLEQIWLPGLAPRGQTTSPHAYIDYFGSFEP